MESEKRFYGLLQGFLDRFFAHPPGHGAEPAEFCPDNLWDRLDARGVAYYLTLFRQMDTRGFARSARTAYGLTVQALKSLHRGLFARSTEQGTDPSLWIALGGTLVLVVAAQMAPCNLPNAESDASSPLADGRTCFGESFFPRGPLESAGSRGVQIDLRVVS
jgi:hypothetical protein